jgi:Na+-driven multidrug efflux pump
VLDPIFIFVLDMGVRGAALATIVSQLVSVIVELIIFLNPKEVIHFHRHMWRIRKDITMRALSIGLAPFLMHLAACFVVIVLNNQLLRYGDDMSIATFGITNRFIFFFVMIVMGIQQGMQPIVGYNYGSKQYDRMVRAFKLAVYSATCVMSVLWLFGEIWPEGFIRLFTHDSLLVESSIAPARVMLCVMCAIGFPMVTGNFYTSIGMAKKAIFLSLTRQVLFLIPLILGMPILFEQLGWDPLWGVWWSWPISDTLSVLTAAILINKDMRTFRLE